MPLFEYYCESCNKTFERLTKDQKATAPCPDCGQEAPKTVSAFAAKVSCSATSSSGFG